MIVQIRHEAPAYTSYAAERTRGLYNVDVEDGRRFEMDVDVPVEEGGWQIGVVVGPSGSGKTSIVRALDEWNHWDTEWNPYADRPLIEILTDVAGSYAKATAALAAVGLGSVPSWLRPPGVLSNGESFRASMALLLLDADPSREVKGPEDLAPYDYILDEFTSVLDRQVAQVGAGAFAKQWRRTPGRRVILITPHYDVLEWLEPDWVIDTAEGADQFAADRAVVRPKAGGTWKRPTIELTIRETKWGPWNAEFKRHHYLPDAGPMAFSTAYTGFVGDEPVCFVGVSGMVTGKGKREARFCRFVTKPEWQGAGVGMRFLEYLCERELRGEGFVGNPTTSIIHSAHPALAVTLRRSPRWRQISSHLGAAGTKDNPTGMGGHLRATMGFRYYGEAGVKAWERKKVKA